MATLGLSTVARTTSVMNEPLTLAWATIITPVLRVVRDGKIVKNLTLTPCKVCPVLVLDMAALHHLAAVVHMIKEAMIRTREVECLTHGTVVGDETAQKHARALVNHEDLVHAVDF